MRLVEFSTEKEPQNSIVSRLARVLAERLDPTDEYDCDVSITLTSKDSINNHPAKEIPTGGYEYLYADYGVELIFSFEDNTDCPKIKTGRIVREYSDSLNREHGITFMSDFDGAEGHCQALAFPVLDEEFTCGVKEPSWT